MAWDTSTLATDGILRVMVEVPQFTLPFLSDGNHLILSGNGGIPSGQYLILSSTNLALPVTQWNVAGSNFFDSNGNFNFTNVIDPSQSQLFYLIRFSTP